MRKKNLLTSIGIIVAISTTITTGIVTTKCLQNKETETSKMSEETANATNEKIEKTTYVGKDTGSLLAENNVVGTWDASATEQDHVTATLYSDGRFVISGTGEMKEPSSSIDIPWNRENIKTAEIKEGVTSIGYATFDECSSLTSVSIPDSVTSIGYYAFDGCSSLTNIEIPSSVTSIGDYAFRGCSSLISIEISEGVISIGNSVFEGCSSLISIDIPNSVTYIGWRAFEDCSNLIAINVNENNKNYTSENGILFNKEKTDIICYPAGKKGEKYQIPEGVTRIEDSAFYKCTSLTSINIPSSVTNIGGQFEACSSLAAINVNENNKNYTSENGVLFNKDKTEIIRYPEEKAGKEYTIPSSVTNIVYMAFEGCSSLISISIPSSVTSIGRYAFDGCSSLTSINISEGVTTIENGAFEGCSSLTSITIPEGVTSIGDRVFEGCSSLISISIPSSVTSIGSWAFGGCSSLTSINIPEGVTSIGWDAFRYCSSLTSINIPSSVTSIGDNAFWGCKHVETIAIGEKAEGEVTIQLPELVKRSLDENDILYAKGKEPTLTNCTISKEEGTMTFKAEDINKKDIKIRINDGALNGVTVVVVPSGTIFYNETNPTAKDVTATIFIAEDEKMINNNGSKEHIFTENGTFTFKYKDKEGKEKEAIAKVDNVDKIAPTIISVEGNPSNWTKENVTLKVNAEDKQSGLAYRAYSFDGGATWQAENTKTYTENTNNIVIQVKDEAENITTKTINISKIDKQAPTITSVEGNPSNWTKENVTLKVNAEDNQSGLADKAYSFDGGTTWQSENTKIYTENTSNIVVKVKDKAENITTKTINISKIDKQAPTITSVEGNPSNWTKENVTLKINAQDSQSGLADKAYSFDGGTTWQAENTKTYTENTNNIVIKVKDKLGNVTTKTINISKIDKQVPAITSIEGNPSNWTTENVTLKVNAEDKQSGLAEKAYSFDGGATWQTGNTKTYTENTNNIVIKVKDKAENITTAATINITKIMKLTGIQVSEAPIKTSYIAGQNFDKTGMKVIATYNNGTKQEITNYTIADGNKLTKEKTSVTISYTENNITKTTQQKIVVKLLKGDANGDGKVDLKDILAINKHRLGKAKLTGGYLETADVTGDNKVDLKDILQINKYRLGKIKEL